MEVRGNNSPLDAYVFAINRREQLKQKIKMQRQIKFRGLRTDSKGWVYGGVVYGKSGKVYIFQGNDQVIGEPDCFEVIHETVGQYTGLKDKNGKECFEGDIVKMCRHSDETNKHEVSKIWKDGKYIERICEVKFVHSSFVVWSELTQSYSAFMYMARPGESFEIIGNVHDNPEMLTL